MKHRIERVESQIQREVDDILFKRIRDPRLNGVTVTDVKITNDLQHVTIYYSILSKKASDLEKVQLGFQKSKGLIRSELGKRIRIYKVPDIKFTQDPSVRYGERIDDLLNSLNDIK